MGVTRNPWSPWRHLRDHYPHVNVYETELPDGYLGLTNYVDSIWIDQGLTQAQRRCTVAHEIGHLERGRLPEGATPAMLAVEEAVVDQWAARRLISADCLYRAFCWSLDFDEIAEELWVDEHTLRSRLRGATDEEQDMIMQAIRRRDHVA